MQYLEFPKFYPTSRNLDNRLLFLQDIATPGLRGSLGAIPGVVGCLGVITYQVDHIDTVHLAYEVAWVTYQR